MFTPGSMARLSSIFPVYDTHDRPGMSAFAMQDGIVYHTYSSYARGLESGGLRNLHMLPRCCPLTPRLSPLNKYK